MKNYIKTISSFLCFIMLFSCICVNAEDIKLYSNGNDVTNTGKYNKGILSAVSEDDGPVALAVYRDGVMVDLKYSDNLSELYSNGLSTVIEDCENTTVKVFGFDDNMAPVCENKNLTPDFTEHRVYFNESFDNGYSARASIGGTAAVPTSDGWISVNNIGNDTGTRFGMFTVFHPDRHVIIEADFRLPSSGKCDIASLICFYNGSPKHGVYMTSAGIKSSSGGSLPYYVKADTIENDMEFNIAIKADIEEFTYDIYYNRTKINPEPLSLADKVNEAKKYDALNFYIPYIPKKSTMTNIYVDNVKAYSGTEFMDIGNKRSTSHRLDFVNSPNWENDIYERPEGWQLAKAVLETEHPRILINSQKLEEIKNTSDKRLISWKERIVGLADSALDTEPYGYAISSTDSMQNIPESLDMMMNLGMAYLLTGNKVYSDRAYREAEVLYISPYKYYNGTLIPEEERDYWNSYSYLDVGEISFILSICYDWMYDAWTSEQRKELAANVMEKGIIRDYQVYYALKAPTINDPAPGWFDSTNNWGAVCNGGVLISALAFMENDPYLCGEVAEAAIRALEYILGSYAPSGAWAEGAGYWAYALKYLTAACASLDSSCGTDYGLSKTPGLEGTQLYSLSIEGKTGVMNYGDGGSSRVNAPFLFYWANKYKNTNIGGAALYIKDVFGYQASCFDLVYYNPEYLVEGWMPPLSYYYQGTEVVSFTSGHDATDSYISISGGKGTAVSHDHLDSGGVVVEMKGKRLFCDLGAEHYGANGYFSTNRYYFFRARPESHNVFIINPEITSDASGNDYFGQARNAVSTITEYDPACQMATMDLSDAYSRDAYSARRSFGLDGNTVIIYDLINLKKESNVYWNWYVATDAENIVVSGDGKSAQIKLNGTVYNVSFETDSDYTLAVEDAVYYVDVDPDPGGRKHSNSGSHRLVVKMENVSGQIYIRTVVN